MKRKRVRTNYSDSEEEEPQNARVKREPGISGQNQPLAVKKEEDTKPDVKDVKTHPLHRLLSSPHRSRPFTPVRVNSLWPPITEDVETSMQYMKRLTSVAVSYILYLRKFLPIDYFEEHSLDYLRLKIIKDKCRLPGCQTVVKTIQGCFQALEQKVLTRLTIRINYKTKAKKKVVESYPLNFTYDTNTFNISLDMKEAEESDSDELTVMGEEIRVLDIKVSIEQLLRSLEFKCKDLSRLPLNASFEIVPTTADGDDLIDEDYFDDVPSPSKYVSQATTCGNLSAKKEKCSEVLAIGIAGQNDYNLTEAQKKLRAYIRKPIKEESGLDVKPKIKVEPK